MWHLCTLCKWQPTHPLNEYSSKCRMTKLRSVVLRENINSDSIKTESIMGWPTSYYPKRSADLEFTVQFTFIFYVFLLGFIVIASQSTGKDPADVPYQIISSEKHLIQRHTILPYGFLFQLWLHQNAKTGNRMME